MLGDDLSAPLTGNGKDTESLGSDTRLFSYTNQDSEVSVSQSLTDYKNQRGETEPENNIGEITDSLNRRGIQNIQAEPSRSINITDARNNENNNLAFRVGALVDFFRGTSAARDMRFGLGQSSDTSYQQGGMHSAPWDEGPGPVNHGNSPLTFSSQRGRVFPVLEISNGDSKRLSLTTQELLRIVHLHNPSNELMDTLWGALKLRDLRQVVSTYADSRPSIELRRNCVLVNLPYVRGIILYQKVLLLPFEQSNILSLSFNSLNGGTTNDILNSSGRRLVAVTRQYGQNVSETSVNSVDPGSRLMSKLMRVSDGKQKFSELAALEAMLIYVCDLLACELQPIVVAADQLLEVIHDAPSSTRKLQQISYLKRRFCALKEKTRGVQRAIRELLNDEEDILRLDLAKFWNDNTLWDMPPKTVDSEDAEILLECYEQEIQAILQPKCGDGFLLEVNDFLSLYSTAILHSDEALDDALQLMELHLASIRNAFLKTEIALDVLSAMFGAIAALAGIFGMNIKNGLEERLDVFWWSCVLFFVFAVSTALAVGFWFKRQTL